MTQLSLGAVVLGGNVFGWTVQREDAFRLLDAFVEGGGRSSAMAHKANPVGAEARSEVVLERLIGRAIIGMRPQMIAKNHVPTKFVGIGVDVKMVGAQRGALDEDDARALRGP